MVVGDVTLGIFRTFDHETDIVKERLLRVGQARTLGSSMRIDFKVVAFDLEWTFLDDAIVSYALQ